MGAAAPGKSGEKWHGVADGVNGPDNMRSRNTAANPQSLGINFMAVWIERTHLLQ